VRLAADRLVRFLSTLNEYKKKWLDYRRIKRLKAMDEFVKKAVKEWQDEQAGKC
jgi:hypothetical protein